VTVPKEQRTIVESHTENGQHVLVVVRGHDKKTAKRRYYPGTPQGLQRAADELGRRLGIKVPLERLK
jgi:hypothetical protein